MFSAELCQFPAIVPAGRLGTGPKTYSILLSFPSEFQESTMIRLFIMAVVYEQIAVCRLQLRRRDLMQGKAQDVNQYLLEVPAARLEALQRLRGLC